MVEIRDNFCKTLDHSDLGITATMRRSNMILQRMDYPLWQHLVWRIASCLGLCHVSHLLAGIARNEPAVLFVPLDHAAAITRV